MSRFKQLLDQYQPAALILEKFGKEDSRRNERISTLAQTMRGFADNRDMDTSVYSREEVSSAVTGKGKVTRNAVARAAADRFPMLRHRLPDDRKLWDSEDGRRCLFDAVALGITHYCVIGQSC